MAISTKRRVCASGLIFVWAGGLIVNHQSRAAQSATQAPQPANPTASLATNASQLNAGLETPWNVRKMVTDLATVSNQLQPLLAAMNPQQWYEKKGAPTTYIIQWQTAQRQLNDVRYATQLLAQKTESLSTALDAYFRLEALDFTARSLEEGAQQYADRASAEQLSALIAKNFSSREHLRDYLRELAASTEQNFKVADEEAQRCRASMSKPPTPGKRH